MYPLPCIDEEQSVPGTESSSELQSESFTCVHDMNHMMYKDLWIAIRVMWVQNDNTYIVIKLLFHIRLLAYCIFVHMYGYHCNMSCAYDNDTHNSYSYKYILQEWTVFPTSDIHKMHTTCPSMVALPMREISNTTY